MRVPISRGNVDWTERQILEELSSFLTVYANRPILDNQGGMRAPHMFALWFLLRRLKPQRIIESGVWWGQGTWLFEQACPLSEIFSIDPVLENRRYISTRANYSSIDFSKQNWAGFDAEKTLVFFDDHQNALQRVQQCRRQGFRRLVFEDNYPAGHGDCFSLKQAWENCEEPDEIRRKRGGNRLVGLLDGIRSPFPNNKTLPAQYLEKEVSIYYEFPPVWIPRKTRWGTTWSAERYPTPPPLFDEKDPGVPEVFRAEAEFYTWLCFVELKKNAHGG